MLSTASFELRYPGWISFGWGNRQEVSRILAERFGDAPPPVYLVASRSALTDARRAEFQALCGDHIVGVFCQVPHDPPLAVVDAVAGELRRTGAAVVLAVGGGSVLDTAKAAAIIAPTGKPVRPFFSGAEAICKPGLPVIALPTTAGSGAEITNNAVLTDQENQVKKSLRSPYMVPVAAVVDAELTVSQPPALTAWSGLDALTQAIESYLSLKANAASRALARQAVTNLMSQLVCAVRNGNDRAARTVVAEGSLLSAMAFSQGGLGAVHGLAHPLGLGLDLAHGLTCAILLPHILRWNASVRRAELDELAAATGAANAAAFLDAVTGLCGTLGVPANFAAAGLKHEHFTAIVANCRTASMKANPRPMSDDDIRALLTQLSA